MIRSLTLLLLILAAAVASGDPVADKAPAVTEARELPLKNLSMEELKGIVESSTLDGANPAGLSCYPEFSAELESELKVTEDDLEFTESLTLERRVADERFLVFKITSNNFTGVHSTDVLAYDEDAGLFRRWRLLPDGRLIRMIGLLDESDEKNVFFFLGRVISWSGTVEKNGEATGQKVIATESVHVSTRKDAPKGDGWIRWHQAFLDEHGVDRRESFRFHRNTQPVEPMPTDLASEPEGGVKGMISRWFGKNDTAPDKPAAPLEDYVFDKLNFRFKNPGARFARMEGPLPNEDITLMLVRTGPSRNFIITAEDAGDAFDFNNKSLASLAQSNLKSVYPNATTGEIREQTINGLEFAVFRSHGYITRTKRCAWMHAALCHNGYFYQMIFMAPSTEPEKVEKEALEIFSNFEIIDEDRKAFGASIVLADAYHRPEFGITADFKAMGGHLWDPADLRKQFPSADFGSLLRMGTGIVIVPVDLESLNPDDDTLCSSLLQTVGVGLEQDVTETKEHEQGVYRGRQYKAIYHERDTDYTHWVRVLRHEDKACVISAFSAGTGPEREEEIRSLLDTVVLSEPSESTETAEADKDDELGQSIAIGLIGLHYFNQNKYEEAVDYFAEAFRRNPRDLVTFGNQLDSLNQLGRVDEALELLEKNEELTDGNADIRIRKAVLLSLAQRREESLSEFRELYDSGTRHDDGLLSYIGILMELNRLDQACDAIDSYVKRHEISSIRVRRWQHQVYSQAGRSEAAVGLARSLSREFPENDQIKTDLVDALIANDEGSEALKIVDELLESDRSSGDPYLLLQKGRALIVTEDYKLAKETLEASLALAPGEPEIQQSLNLVSALLGQGDHSIIRQELPAVTPPEELEKAMAGIGSDEPDPGFNSRMLRSTTGYHFESGKPLRRTEFCEIAVLNFSGVAENKTVTHSFNPTYERAYVNFIEVLDESGAKVSEGKISDYYVSEGQGGFGGMATGDKLLNAPVPGLKPGHVLRYQLTVESKASSEEFPFERLLFATFAPSGPRAIFVTGDVGEVRSIEDHGTFTTGRGEGFLYWMLPDPPRIQLESYQPQLDKFLPSLTLGSNHSTWREVATEYLDGIEDRLAPEKTVEELAGELTDGIEDEEARTRAILRFVQRDLNYQAIEFGKRARTPNRASLTIKNRYGDCKDHSVLARQLLKASGKDSQLALVSSGYRIHDQLPSLDQFDHMILFIPGDDGGRFVDCTSKNEGFTHQSPSLLQGRMALVLDSDQSALVRIPEGEPDEHVITTERTIRIGTPETDLVVEETTTFSNSQAVWIRTQMQATPEADRKASLVQLLGSDSRLKIDTLEIENLEELDRPLVLRLHYTIHRSLREREGERSGNLPAIWESLYFKEGSRGRRMTPFEISMPYRFDSTVVVIHPTEGGKMRVSAPSKNAEHPWCEWRVSSEETEEKTTLRCSLKMKSGMHPKDSYDTFSQSMNAMLEAIKAEIEITN